MRKFILLYFAVLTVFTATAQDFSNKGKDFWVAYGYHTQMQPAKSHHSYKVRWKLAKWLRNGVVISKYKMAAFVILDLVSVRFPKSQMCSRL